MGEKNIPDDKKSKRQEHGGEKIFPLFIEIQSFIETCDERYGNRQKIDDKI
jgi:hypothetical protein